MSRSSVICSSWLCSAVAVAVACAGNPTRPDEVPLGRPFELRVGAAAVVDGGLQIRFERVRSDSRCPMDALCVRAGEAVLALRFSRAGRDPIEQQLQTDPPRLSEIQYQGYTIKLNALAPYPRSDRQIQQGDYLVTLVVTRH